MCRVSPERSARQWWRFTSGITGSKPVVDKFTEEFTFIDHAYQLKQEIKQHTRHSAGNLWQFINTIAEYYGHIRKPVSDAEKVEHMWHQMHPTFQDLTRSLQFTGPKEAKDDGARHEMGMISPMLPSTTATNKPVRSRACFCQ